MRCACPGDSGDSSFHGGYADDLEVSRPTRLLRSRSDKVYCQLEAVSICSQLGKSVCRSSARMGGYPQLQKGWFVVRKLEFKLLQLKAVPPLMLGAPKETARVQGVRCAELSTCCACPSESVPAEIDYTRPAFKKAYDLLRANLQLLRDLRRCEVFRQ